MGDMVKETRIRNRVEIAREIILSRRSCRAFLDKPIPKKDLLELIEAGVYAPSGHNAQNQRFLLIDDKKEIQRIGSVRWSFPYKLSISHSEMRKVKPYGIFGGAAALIFVFADTTLTAPINSGEYYIWESLETQNGAASIQNMLLLASVKGIGNCWGSSYESMNYSRLLSGQTWRDVFAKYKIPFSYKMQGAIMLGYPKHLDSRGYPKGENVHGVLHESVERHDLKHYIIQKKQNPGSEKNLGGFGWFRVKAYRKTIGFLLKCVKVLDRLIYRIEME